MRRYISIVSVRQADFNIYLLWDCGRFLTASDCRRLFRFNSRPVGRRSVRTTSSRWIRGFLLDVLVAVDLRGLFSIVRCMFVPVLGACPTTVLKYFCDLVAKRHDYMFRSMGSGTSCSTKCHLWDMTS